MNICMLEQHRYFNITSPSSYSLLVTFLLAYIPICCTHWNTAHTSCLSTWITVTTPFSTEWRHTWHFHNWHLQTQTHLPFTQGSNLLSLLGLVQDEVLAAIKGDWHDLLRRIVQRRQTVPRPSKGSRSKPHKKLIAPVMDVRQLLFPNTWKEALVQTRGLLKTYILHINTITTGSVVLVLSCQ